MEKSCHHCGGTFRRPKDYSAKQWAARRFCSLSCSKLATAERNTVQGALELYSPEPNSGCWLWLGTISRYGYGQIALGGRLVLAHRLFFKHHKGPIPDGLLICHHCDNPACVNPDHLYAGTAQQNTDDAVRRRRLAYGGRNRSAVLTEANVREIRESDSTDAALARHYGVSRPAIRNARTGKTWSHV